MAWPASRAEIDRMATEVSIYLHALWAGLIHPFCDLFNAMLSQYQINALHLDPQSIILLVVFAFVCEAMVGIAPSVDFLHHFFSLHQTDPLQCSRCVSLQAVAATAGSGIKFELSPVLEGFRKCWVFVDVGVRSPCCCSHGCQLLRAPVGGMRSLPVGSWAMYGTGWPG